jgi:molybdopterin converting factor small subunit
MSNDPDEFDEDLGEEEEEEEEPEPVIEVKKPKIASKVPSSGSKGSGDDISLYFMSTIGPGEKKQKLLVNTGNLIKDIKRTVGNIFGLNPNDFHLSHGGVTMDDASPLSKYKLKDGDTVLLIPASTAG